MKELHITGEHLPNGSEILLIFQNSNEHGIVGAHVRTGEWATWEFYRGELDSTSTGHYFTDYDAMAEDFILRVAHMRRIKVSIEGDA